MFRQVVPLRFHGVSFDAPVLSSIDPWAFALSVAAAIAIFRFKIGMLSILAACSFAGVILYLLGAVE
jgi:chromate transporter